MFGVQPNVPLMHQVVTAQLAARRSGTQSTKTRAEVRGGGKKPFKQKGTGNARQGSTRSPHMSGGGVAHGPKPRKYDQKTPKKMIKLALRSALSDRAADGKVVVVDSWGFEAPKTKDAKKLLGALGIEGKALVVVDIDDTNTIKSFLNLPEVQLIESRELNAYDVLCSDYVVFSHATLPGGGEVIEKPAKKAAAKKAARQEGGASSCQEGRGRRREEAPARSRLRTTSRCRRRPRTPRVRRSTEGLQDQGQRRLGPLPRSGLGLLRPHRRRDLVQDCRRCRGRRLPAAAEPATSTHDARRDERRVMKDPRDIILAPVVSEKSYGLIEQGVYTFIVHPSASKPEISDAVKAIWGVDVIQVNTLNRKGKVTRGRRSNRSGSKPDTKRALVKLAAGNEIPLFES